MTATSFHIWDCITYSIIQKLILHKISSCKPANLISSIFQSFSIAQKHLVAPNVLAFAFHFMVLPSLSLSELNNFST